MYFVLCGGFFLVSFFFFAERASTRRSWVSANVVSMLKSYMACLFEICFSPYIFFLATGHITELDEITAELCQGSQTATSLRVIEFGNSSSE